MMHLYKAVIVILCAALLAGCKEEKDRNETSANPTQTQQIQAAMTDLNTIGQVADQTTSANAKGTLTALYGNYDSLVQSVFSQSAAQPPAFVGPGQTVNCTTGTYVWAAGSITYNNCDGLNGTVTWADTSYTIDITYDFAAGGMESYTGQFSAKGTVAISSTLINGSLHLAYQIAINTGGQQINYDSDYEVAYDNIGLDATGCPQSGAMDIEGDWSYSAAGQSYDKSFHLTAEFNACGDVTILS